MKKRYSILTHIFNDYELVHEVLNPLDNVEYILVTDDPNLTSLTWTIIYDDSLINLSGFDKTFYVRYNCFKYCSTDICVRIDGSVKILNSLDNIVNDFIEGNYDLGLMINPFRCNIVDELNAWVKYRNYSNKNVLKNINYLESINYDLSIKGLIQQKFTISKRGKLIDEIDNRIYNILKTDLLNEDGTIERLDQTLTTAILSLYYSNLKYFWVTDKLVFDSNILVSNMHKTNIYEQRNYKYDWGGDYELPWMFDKILEVHEYHYKTNDCCVVIPIYENKLSELDKISLQQCVKILGKHYDIYLAKAITVTDTSLFYEATNNYSFKEVTFNNWDGTYDSYNSLNVSYDFYNYFKDYKYMLIYQFDCWVFKDNLQYFINLNYDYYGAVMVTYPYQHWPKFMSVGNGGLCLIKTSVFADIFDPNGEYLSEYPIEEYIKRKKHCFSDAYICNEMVDNYDLKLCDKNTALKFAWDLNPQFTCAYYELPMGVHAIWKNIDFWKDYIELSDNIINEAYDKYKDLIETNKNKCDRLHAFWPDPNEKIKDKLDIFVCAHKNFNTLISNNIYKIITDKDTVINQYVSIIREDTSKDNINNLQISFGECSRIYYIWKNYDVKDYIGFCHYRRYFNLGNDLSKINDTFEKYDIIIPLAVLVPKSIYEHYKEEHNIEDLDLCIDIIKEKFPTFKLDKLNSNIFIIGNMFIMKNKDFNEYCEFLFGILLEYCKRMKFICMDDIDKYILLNPDKYYHSKNNDYNLLSYQRRLCGFLAERLTTLWILNKYDFNKIKQLKVGTQAI